MLMSLTMRLLPTPPEDARGVTSVVAIPTPSFNSGAKILPAGFSIARNETFHYTAALAGCPAEIARLAGGGNTFWDGGENLPSWRKEAYFLKYFFRAQTKRAL